MGSVPPMLMYFQVVDIFIEYNILAARVFGTKKLVMASLLLPLGKQSSRKFPRP